MLRLLLASLAVVALAGPAAAADTTYRDPRRPSFTLLVPDGWTAETHGKGVTLKRDGAYFALVVNPGATSPGAMLVQMRSQFEPQWKQFRELEAGRTAFGGQAGGYAVYAGIPPSGVSSVTRVVTMTNGTLTYVAFAESHADQLKENKADLDRIERSFAPDPPN